MGGVTRGIGCLTLAAAVLTGTGEVRAQDYDSPATEAMVKAVIEAHGGWERWAASEAVSFDHIMFDRNADTPETSSWWITEETVEQGRRRTYMRLPLEEGWVANDGETVWSINWEKFNPPRMMTLTHYYFAFLPWLTQDASVNVRSLGEEALPGQEVAYPKLEITWDVGPEDVSGRMFMFVDPETHLLKGMGHTVTYGHMLDAMQLPPEVREVGPAIHVIDELNRYDGLLIPGAFRTFMRGQEIGSHVIKSVDLNADFDEGRLEMPPGAVVDETSPRRRTSS